MYAIVQIGSKQYKISEGDVIAVDRLDSEVDKTFTIDHVLLLADGKTVKVGQPYLSGVKVTAKVMKQSLGVKTIAFKYRKRKSSATTKGGRQKLTDLHITKISAK